MTAIFFLKRFYLLFLETLLSAREVFYLSYVGKDVRDNTDKAPATVVTELLAYLNASYKNVTGHNLAGQNLAGQNLAGHRRYFDQSDQKLHNFKPLWFEAASTERKNVTFIDRAESRSLSESTTPSDMALEEPSGRVAVGQLTDYFIRPSQHYLLEQLQVRPAYAEDDLQDTEEDCCRRVCSVTSILKKVIRVLSPSTRGY